MHWVKPELVAEIKFTEWTHESAEGGMKLRAPVFLRLRDDKDPKECSFQFLVSGFATQNQKLETGNRKLYLMSFIASIEP